MSWGKGRDVTECPETGRSVGGYLGWHLSGDWRVIQIPRLSLSFRGAELVVRQREELLGLGEVRCE